MVFTSTYRISLFYKKIKYPGQIIQLVGYRLPDSNYNMYVSITLIFTFFQPHTFMLLLQCPVYFIFFLPKLMLLLKSYVHFTLFSTYKHSCYYYKVLSICVYKLLKILLYNIFFYQIYVAFFKIFLHMLFSIINLFLSMTRKPRNAILLLLKGFCMYMWYLAIIIQ